MVKTNFITNHLDIVSDYYKLDSDKNAVYPTCFGSKGYNDLSNNSHHYKTMRSDPSLTEQLMDQSSNHMI